MMNTTQSVITFSLIKNPQICNVLLVIAKNEDIAYLSAFVLSNAKFRSKDAAAKEIAIVGITSVRALNLIEYAVKVYAKTVVVPRAIKITGVKIMRSLIPAIN